MQQRTRCQHPTRYTECIQKRRRTRRLTCNTSSIRSRQAARLMRLLRGTKRFAKYLFNSAPTATANSLHRIIEDRKKKDSALRRCEYPRKKAYPRAFRPPPKASSSLDISASFRGLTISGSTGCTRPGNASSISVNVCLATKA